MKQSRQSKREEARARRQQYRARVTELATELIALLTEHRYPAGWGQVVTALRHLKGDIIWSTGAVRIEDVPTRKPSEPEDILETLRRNSKK